MTTFPKVVAQASLADTLLKLNTGLVNIIAAFLSSDPANVQLDLRSLTKLSDTSRKEALDALGQLYSRLSKSTTELQQPVTKYVKPRPHDHRRHSSTSLPSKSKSKAKENGTMPITGGVLPSLVKSVAYTSMPVPSQRTRGSWVRPRRPSASSSVTIVSADARSSSVPSRTVAIAPTPTRKTPISPPISPRISPPILPLILPSISPSRSPPIKSAGPSDQPRPVQFTTKKAPPVPTKPAALQSPSPMRLLKASPSVYSFASDSTKLGEIPQHKWATPAYFQALEARNPAITAAPADAYIGGEEVRDKGKAKAKFLNFFRRGATSTVEVDPV